MFSILNFCSVLSKKRPRETIHFVAKYILRFRQFLSKTPIYLNLDFQMIFVIGMIGETHVNQFNHLKIIVLTKAVLSKFCPKRRTVEYKPQNEAGGSGNFGKVGVRVLSVRIKTLPKFPT
jgi:hypothetical protein